MLNSVLLVFFSCYQGAEIVQVVLDHGKLRPPDILSRLSRYDLKSTFSPVPCRPARPPTLNARANRFQHVFTSIVQARIGILSQAIHHSLTQFATGQADKIRG